ncbi:type I glutamate--ammonia ligase [Dictyobacter aurantiacus]|uniref:Glutamine synthetase n=1 Tax=Dictyobacter aurantiacus TaxID=1936993 RepID=A0A401Z7V9_9CHLR|nr:type I glutamate--ammonia ligase [Dictyobacter aurantiacus]GCE02919.1 glutamine synthetase [Dictyobacter aurantiacus]
MTPEEVLKLAKENGVKIVDFKFSDLPGTWQHFSVPVHVLSEDLFSEGLPFDGSSVRGFQTINESDMLVIPDADTAFLDPFTNIPTLSLTCDIAHPGRAGSQKPYSRDPRYIARKAEDYLRSTGIADTAFFGPEAEFYIFDNVRYASGDNIQYAEVDSEEAHWNSKGREDARNLGHLMNVKGGYFPVAPSDTYQDLRSEMVMNLENLGITVEAHHHEVGAAGQCEIDYKFGTLLNTADKLLLFKYVIKNTARKYGKSVTFMPKPVYGDNGSGMHTHQSLWKNGQPLFYEEGSYANLSQMARYYIGGVLTHAPSILAIAASSTNSYKRLVPGFEAPVNLVFSQGNRSAAIRIPRTESPKATRVEFRPPDPTANPYLLFSALLMAGLDGIRNEIDPSQYGYGPVDKDLYSMSKEELREISSVPGSLDESLKALENDHAFLLEGGVFTSDVLEKYVDLKREQADQVRLRPNPIEFSMYYDA